MYYYFFMSCAYLLHGHVSYVHYCPGKGPPWEMELRTAALRMAFFGHSALKHALY